MKGSHVKGKHNNIVSHRGYKKLKQTLISQKDTKDSENNPPSPPFNKGGQRGIFRSRPPDAKAYALRLLSYRSRGKKEIIQKLKEKGFDVEEIKRVIDFLEDTGLIKDESLAEGLLRNALGEKHLGRKGIKMLLATRGIEKELIDETLSTITEDMEQESAMRFVEKKLRTLKNYSEDVIKQKLWRMLERKGFSVEVINSVIKTVLGTENSF